MLLCQSHLQLFDANNISINQWWRSGSTFQRSVLKNPDREPLLNDPGLFFLNNPESIKKMGRISNTLRNDSGVATLLNLHANLIYGVRTGLTGRSSRSARAELSSLLRESESPLTLSSEDLSIRSSSPRFNSTRDVVDADK